MRWSLISFVACLLIGPDARGQVAPESDLPAVVHTTIVRRATDRPIVSFAVGANVGISTGDPFWVLSDNGLAATGTIYLVTGRQCVGRLSRSPGTAEAGESAAILPKTALSELRNGLPPGIRITGTVSRTPPGRRTAWLDLGRNSGLKPDDQIMIRRNAIPIARGRIALLENDVALAELRPLVSNALPEAGDSAELWPAPALQRAGRLDSCVLDVRSSDEGPVITIVGTANDGLVEDRLVDLYRREEYVGVASITRVMNPLSEARLIEPASPSVPHVADVAIVRSGARDSLSPLSAAVFRIDGAYALVAAGESDGLRIGDNFRIRRVDPAEPSVWQDIAELTVTAVKVDYADTKITMLVDDGTKVKVWDMAERVGVTAQRWQSIGLVETAHAESRALTAHIEPGAKIIPGQVVRWTLAPDEPAGAAVLIRMENGQAILYVPPGWGKPADSVGARIDAPSDLPSQQKTPTSRYAPPEAATTSVSD